MPHVPTLFDWLEANGISTPLSSMLLTLILVMLSIWGVRRSVARDEGVIPSEKLTFRNFIELLLEGLMGQMKTAIGPEWARFAPLVATLGFFILVSNLMGLVPGLTGPTSFLETNLAWAAIAFVTYNTAGFQKHGIGYLKHFLGPVPLLAPLMLPIEIISHLSRMGSLTVRLTANMFADHTLVAIFLSFPVVIALAVPWLVMGLGLFVAFLQAFIFSYLTMVYIGMAVEDHH